MCEVYMFPQKKSLPKNLEEQLYRAAKDHIEALYASLMILSSDGTTKEEALDLVSIVYANGLEKAVEELEKEL